MPAAATWRSRLRPSSHLPTAALEDIAPTEHVAAAEEPIQIDVKSTNPPAEINLDDRPAVSYTDEEWEALEAHMAAYFNADTDILAQAIPHQRFVGKWRFVAKYRHNIDKKFPYAADSAVRSKIDDFFGKLEVNASRLFRSRLISLAIALTFLFGATFYYVHNAAPPPAPGASQEAPLADAAPGARSVSSDLVFAAGLIVLMVFYFGAWSSRSIRAKQANQQLYTDFQSYFQLGIVTRLFSRYMSTHDAIATTRLRPAHTTAEEAKGIVHKIERLVMNMVWTAKRVEYYDKRFEVSYWLMLHQHMLLNVGQLVFAAALFCIYAVGVLLFVNSQALLDINGLPVPILWSVLIVGLIFAAGPILLSMLLPVGDSDEIKTGLQVDTWTRFSKFNLHNQLAKVVGDQVRRIHHEEDRVR